MGLYDRSMSAPDMTSWWCVRRGQSVPIRAVHLRRRAAQPRALSRARPRPRKLAQGLAGGDSERASNAPIDRADARRNRIASCSAARSVARGRRPTNGHTAHALASLDAGVARLAREFDEFTTDPLRHVPCASSRFYDGVVHCIERSLVEWRPRQVRQLDFATVRPCAHACSRRARL